jgi:hypothetical protein
MIISGQPNLVSGGGTCHQMKQQTFVGETYFKNVYSRNSFREGVGGNTSFGRITFGRQTDGQMHLYLKD